MIYFQHEVSRGLFLSPAEAGAEQTVVNLVLWLKLAVEIVGAAVVVFGVLTAVFMFARSKLPPHFERYNEIRLTLARFLALALELQLGADILATAVAPSWSQIGKLGAIAVIRTALNYFLSREMREERVGLSAEGAAEGVRGDER